MPDDIQKGPKEVQKMCKNIAKASNVFVHLVQALLLSKYVCLLRYPLGPYYFALGSCRVGRDGNRCCHERHRSIRRVELYL